MKRVSLIGLAATFAIIALALILWPDNEAQRAVQAQQDKLTATAEIHLGGTPIFRTFADLRSEGLNEGTSRLILRAGTFVIQPPVAQSTSIVLRVEGRPYGEQYAKVRLSHPNWGTNEATKKFRLDENGEQTIVIHLGEAYSDHIHIM